MREYIRAGIGYNSEDEANLAAEIPTIYLDRGLDAGYIAEAIIESDWLAAHDAEHLTATRERLLSSEAVEAAARASFETGSGDWTWDDMLREEADRAEIWRDDARAVLRAVLAVLTPMHEPHHFAPEKEEA